MSARSQIVVPASTSNLGPGFDSLGLALSRCLTVTVEPADDLAAVDLRREGEGADEAIAPEDDLFLRALSARQMAFGERARGARVGVRSAVPLARGLGSSASCIVAAVMTADALAGRRHDPGSVFRFAAALEGHPDNVAPAVYGGLTCAVMDGDTPRALALGAPPGLLAVVAIPAERASTKAMRGVLPESVPHRVATANLGRAVFLSHALAQGRYEGLAALFDDALHQPYRSAFVTGFADAVLAAKKAGALGVFLSGSGSTVCALTETAKRATNAVWIARGLRKSYEARKVACEVVMLDVAPGATVTAVEAS